MSGPELIDQRESRGMLEPLVGAIRGRDAVTVAHGRARGARVIVSGIDTADLRARIEGAVGDGHLWKVLDAVGRLNLERTEASLRADVGGVRERSDRQGRGLRIWQGRGL